MDRLLFESHHAATAAAPRELRHGLSPILRHAVPDRSVRNRMELLLSEAATNLVQHAIPPPSRIGIRFGRDSACWWLDVLDDGGGWDPDTRDAAHGLADFGLMEHGRGLGLLNSQCDHMEYSEDGQGNRLRLQWRLPEQQDRPRVLIVDDDPAQSRLCAAYLAERFETVTAADGLQALERLQAGNIDLVLSDIRMPNLDGMQLREMLDRHRPDTLTPFIFLTGLDDGRQHERAAGMGVDDYLRKPVEKAILIRTIERVLERSKQIQNTLANRLDQRITRSLSPRLPQANRHWRLALAQRHTGAGGGDFLLHAPGDDSLTLALADIMGHDDSAKFFCHAYAGYLRGLMHANGHQGEPGRLLDMLSTAAWQDELFSQVTLTACVLCLKQQGRIILAGAAHPPPLRIHGKGIEPLAVSGILPGLLPSVSYAPLSIDLAPGERLAVYTDGLFDSSPTAAGRQMLEAHIKTVLQDTLHRPINESLQATMSAFDQLAGNPGKDDALLLLIEPAV